jgi:hypothetical protein
MVIPDGQQENQEYEQKLEKRRGLSVNAWRQGYVAYGD